MKGVGILLLPVLVLLGCGDAVGESCKLSSGALGFGFKSDCRTKCLELDDVTCPDGSTVRKAVCAGAEGCEPGSCGEGQVCYSFEDPFEKDFYCIPDDICGSSPTAVEAAAWEWASRERSDALRAKFEERAKRRTGETTAPADVAETVPR
jgi:hypothetical protein